MGNIETSHALTGGKLVRSDRPDKTTGRFLKYSYLCQMAQVQEVDLHLKAFMRNVTGLTAESMVRLSLERMCTALDKAIESGQSEIRFIHGHGTGVLKERVYQELRVYEKNGLIARFEPSFFNPAIINVIIRF